MFHLSPTPTLDISLFSLSLRFSAISLFPPCNSALSHFCHPLIPARLSLRPRLSAFIERSNAQTLFYRRVSFRPMDPSGFASCPIFIHLHAPRIQKHPPFKTKTRRNFIARSNNVAPSLQLDAPLS